MEDVDLTNPYKGLRSLHCDQAVVAIPGSTPELLGITGIRGSIVPVFSLDALLGYGSHGPGRWLALCGDGDIIGLCFSDLDAYRKSELGEIIALSSTQARRHVAGLLGAGSDSAYLLDTTSILAAIARSETCDDTE